MLFRSRQVGGYTIVALTAAAPLPALSGTLDADIAAAIQGGVELRQRKLSAQ